MKNKIFTAFIFIIVFITCYLALCFLIPGWAIKLDAPIGVYFIESLKHNAIVKLIISFIVSLISAVIVIIAGNIPSKND